MKLNTYSQVALLLLAFFCFTSIVQSQTTLTGLITDDSGETLIGANVIVKGTTDGTVTDIDGTFTLKTSQKPPFTVVVSYTGFTSQEVEVTDAGTPINVALTEGLIGQEVVVSASRKREKVQEAPASVSVLGARQLEGSPQTDPVRNLVNVPGVQIQQQSAARINIEMRGSSGIFGTSVFPIMDYRSLIGPGIGTFQSDAVGLSTIDMARIEVVRGPGSALYGPGVTSGVVHFITKNPIDYPGTTVQVGYGELNTFVGAVRHAGTNANKTFGYKINAQYNKGNEFTLDPKDPEDAAQIALFKKTIVRPAVAPDGHVDLTQPGKVLLTESDLDPDKDGNPMQDDWWNTAFNATLEFRPQDDLSIFVSGGYNQASAVFYNDLGEGLSQASEIWTQARVQKGGLFAQVFYVDNDGGTDDNPTFLYQTGNMTGVGRKQLEGQVQYNLETPSFLNADWTAGVDYRQAISDTRSLTYGRHENDDDYNIFGGYLQGKFALVDKLDLVLAGRYDVFNFLDEGFFSPRVALVLKASPRHTFRASFNRAGAPPSALETYIDFPVNAPIPGLFDFWLAGQTDQQIFDDNALIDVTLPGVPDLPWGTPGLPLAIPYGAVNEGVLAQLIPGLMADPQTAPLAPAIEQFLMGYTPTGFTGNLFGVNAFENNSPLNELINTNKSTISVHNTFEVGYKGLFEDKLSVSVDIYRIERSGFSDFTQIGPLVTLQNADIPNDLGAAVAADITPFLVAILTPAIGQAAAEATAAQLAPAIGGAYTAGGQGFVDGVNAATPDNNGAALFLGSIFGAVETNRSPQNDGIVHVPAGYRIFPDASMTYWGSDIGLEYYFSSDFSAWFNYSWLSETEFRGKDLGEPEDSPLSVSLNAPKNKFRFGLNYTPAKGIRGNLSFQHDDAFDASVGLFSGKTEEKNLIDAGIGYNFGNGLAIDLTGQNILNNEYRTFVHMPKIGRRVLVKATYTFGADKE
ncbi:MAG TPA: TonB-dependent receptor [Bacteroidetes bacterium]|nr:TonB-dependent receptor [Bacteroidota bacterium]